MGLEAEIWALMLGEGEGAEEKKKEEKIPYMCDSIGHRPLRGRCPKGDQPTVGYRPTSLSTDGPTT